MLISLDLVGIGREITLRTVERMASEVFIPLTVGGGVRELADIRKLLAVLGRLVDLGNTVVVPSADARPQWMATHSPPLKTQM